MQSITVSSCNPWTQADLFGEKMHKRITSPIGPNAVRPSNAELYRQAVADSYGLASGKSP